MSKNRLERARYITAPLAAMMKVGGQWQTTRGNAVSIEFRIGGQVTIGVRGIEVDSIPVEPGDAPDVPLAPTTAWQADDQGNWYRVDGEYTLMVFCEDGDGWRAAAVYSENEYDGFVWDTDDEAPDGWTTAEPVMRAADKWVARMNR